MLAFSAYFPTSHPNHFRRTDMLRLAIVFLIIALIAAFLGFGGVAALSWEGAKILFVIFIVLLIVSFIMRALRGGPVA